MNDVVSYILDTLVGLAVVLVMGYFIPWLKTQLENSKYKWLVDVIEKGVLAAEQKITDPKTGAIKKEAVVEIANKAIEKRHIKIDSDLVDAIIESAVFAMNEQKKKAA